MEEDKYIILLPFCFWDIANLISQISKTYLECSISTLESPLIDSGCPESILEGPLIDWERPLLNWKRPARQKLHIIGSAFLRRSQMLFFD